MATATILRVRTASVGLLLLLLLATTARATPANVGALIWSDEFDGTQLDTTRWNHRALGPRRDGVNTAQAVSVGSGALKITTYTDAGTHYTGMVGTQNRFQATYGYFEARIQMNNSPGMWSAFWLQSPTLGNPIGNPAAAGVEVDVVEHRAADFAGNDIQDKYATALHWDGYAANHQTVSEVHGPLSGLSNGTWHNYGVRWSPTSYEFYFDDLLVWTTSAAVSQRSQYMILSSEVLNNDWAGVIPAAGFGSLATSVARMSVDYVRVYALPEPGSATGAVVLGFVALLARRRRRTRAMTSSRPQFA